MSASLSQMEEHTEQDSDRSIPKGPTLCEECKSNPSRYKCPGCIIHSCSLPCVKSHKVCSGCTGVRNKTQFVPLSQFDDNILLSDYSLLEETKRVAESSWRMRTKLGRRRRKIAYSLSFKLYALRSIVNINWGGGGTLST